ncbi:hypothetical protein, partial [Pseudomonas tolaasii]
YSFIRVNATCPGKNSAFDSTTQAAVLLILILGAPLNTLVDRRLESVDSGKSGWLLCAFQSDPP